MQLVEHQELQAIGGGEHPLVVGVGARQQQFEHHEVGEQDIGRVRGDGGALLLILLAGVAGEGHRLAARGEARR